MTSTEAPKVDPRLAPVRAQTEWLALAAVLVEQSPVPCQTSDAEAWWPDQRGLGSPGTRAAVDACRRCAARVACLDYAIAADERFGVWGATLPEERRRSKR